MRHKWKIVVALAIGFLAGILITLDVKEALLATGSTTVVATEPNVTASTTTSNAALETRNFSFDNFDSIVSSGAWVLHIKAGDKFQISIVAPASLWQNVAVTKQDHELHLDFKEHSGVSSLFNDRGPRADITLPTIAGLSLHGIANVVLQNFTLDKLQVSDSGASSAEGINNKIKMLLLKNSGGNSIFDFRLSFLTNVDFDLLGTTRAFLNMQGGDLTGKINGFANIFYTGTVNQQSFTQSGLVRLIHQKDFPTKTIILIH